MPCIYLSPSTQEGNRYVTGGTEEYYICLLYTSVSNTAGTYVCNDLMYGLLYHIRHSFPTIRGGFVHVPYATCQVVDKPGTPSLSVQEMIKGITAALGACVENTQDVHTAEGAEH